MKKDCILWIITSIFHVKLKIPLGIIKLLIIVPYKEPNIHLPWSWWRSNTELMESYRETRGTKLLFWILNKQKSGMSSLVMHTYVSNPDQCFMVFFILFYCIYSDFPS